ncbi:hypothetical protein FHR83_008737 [Actinoplanes campanulatus]|uniref:Uncharacterized protein n=1 Tax=Actinoplanes campanulatus TaxID=113559 RepID=A0A7W5ARL7_9ACTN|nr:hypothetical protein [Actinoplanes campanulatus]MBB3101010.1 hypothetical protein [Actinoplanes campanulatus]GGN49216.1 hypothetical protein GCM10010109_87020 [Actinoplanes campanulatus]GID41827.1 hypothetical protein Aca09nite_83330 [Actinoplanes campanulatus]
MGDLDRGNVVPIVVGVADWLRIDGVMDNEIRDLRDKCFESEVPDQLNPFWVELTENAESIRQAGWDQLPGWPKESKGFRSWPAPGQTQEMHLGARQWGLIVSALERWATLDDEDGHQESAAFLRRVAAEVRTGYEQQAGRPLPAVRPDW